MHDGEVYSAEWSQNGQYIVTASSDGTAKIWSAQGELVRPLHGHSREVMSAKFSPDDALVVTASQQQYERCLGKWRQATTSPGFPNTLIGSRAPRSAPTAA